MGARGVWMFGFSCISINSCGLRVLCDIEWTDSSCLPTDISVASNACAVKIVQVCVWAFELVKHCITWHSFPMKKILKFAEWARHFASRALMDLSFVQSLATCTMWVSNFVSTRKKREKVWKHLSDQICIPIHLCSTVYFIRWSIWQAITIKI